MKPTITIEATDELKELIETVTKKIDAFVEAVKRFDVYTAEMYDDLYFCDPEKNTTCRKTECYIYGGECHLTSQKAYRWSKRREEDD